LQRQRRLTSDLDRFAEQQAWRAAQPELALGPPSWHWLAEAFAATGRLRADPRLRNISTPVQMLLADEDRLVDTRAARAVAAILPDAEVHRFGPESAHEILREVDVVRDRALVAIDDFLDRRAPK
jgi:lysophospholipase